MSIRTRIAAVLSLAVAAAALAGCGNAHSSAPALHLGKYSGTLPGGAPVTLGVDGGQVRIDGRDTYLVDPTTTAQFLVAEGNVFYEWSCTQAEKGRSLHCDTWKAPHGQVTPTALPCATSGPGTPGWCAGPTHEAVDLLRICSTPDC